MNQHRFFESYLSNQNPSDLRRAIQDTRDKFDDTVLERWDYLSDTQVLLYGDVQSGKTSHMLGLIAHCLDIGFPTVLILTSDNTHLVSQTFDRAFENFPGAELCAPDDDERFRKNMMRTQVNALPSIVVLNKNKRVLDKWTKVLSESGVLTGQPLLIVDDEADAASQNTKINKHDKSTIHKQIDVLRKQSTGCVYLQVTGTPQAIILQSALDGWRPDHVLSFPPGGKYVGGSFFFDDMPGNAHTMSFAADSPDEERADLRSAVVTHMITSALSKRAGVSVCNMLIHPSHLKEVHTDYMTDVRLTVREILSKLNDSKVRAEIDKTLCDLKETYTGKITSEEVISQLLAMKKDFAFVTVNSESDANQETWASGYNFIVGGNSLGRGLTFNKLQTVFYCRQSKRPQADTLWQHASMFGYDRDRDTLRLFIPGDLVKIFQEVHGGNEAIKRQLGEGKAIEKLRVMLDTNVSPTRSTVLNQSLISHVTGGVNYFATNPTIPRLKELDEKL